MVTSELNTQIVDIRGDKDETDMLEAAIAASLEEAGARAELNEPAKDSTDASDDSSAAVVAARIKAAEDLPPEPDQGATPSSKV